MNSSPRHCQRYTFGRVADHDWPAWGRPTHNFKLALTSDHESLGAPLDIGQTLGFHKQIRVVSHAMGNTPGNIFIVAEMRESGHTWEAKSNGVKFRALHVKLVVHVREFDTSMRITG